MILVCTATLVIPSPKSSSPRLLTTTTTWSIYLIFGLAFICRPIGGIVTGHIGDLYGRKRALLFSMTCMICPTVLMGCLPTYSQCGVISIALLTLCRCLQGFSVGGQLSNAF